MLEQPQDYRDLVTEILGEKYVDVVASAIERLANERNDKFSRSEGTRLCIQARDFFDKFEKTIFKPGKYPIGSRREIMCDYLAGRDVSQFTSRS